jgi:hypothetical protein
MVSTVLALLAAIATSILAVFWPPASKSDASAYIVAADRIIWDGGIDLNAIGCVTLNRNIANPIYKIDYSDDPAVLEILRRHLRGKIVTSNDPSCPYVLTFVVMVSDTHAIRYAGQIARMMMTFSLIEKNPVSGSLYYEGMHFKGNYKNLYLFRTGLQPLEAFEVGLKAFLATQQKNFDVIRISVAGA